MELKEETGIKQEEKTPIALKFAPAWKRILSFLIDLFIIGIILFIIINIVYQKELKMITESENSYKLYVDFMKQNYFQLNFASIVIYVSYFGILWAGIAQTIGAKIMKIYVISINSRKIGFFASFFRALLLYLSSNVFYIPLFFIINPVYKQRLHDVMTNSVVIEKPELKKEE